MIAGQRQAASLADLLSLLSYNSDSDSAAAGVVLSEKIKETTHEISFGKKRLQILQDVSFYDSFYQALVF